MQQILLGVQIVLAATVIGLVLIQQGRGADAGASFGGGASGSLFGSRGPATFLAKITGLMATLFFINSIGLAYLAADAVRGQSVVERVAPAPNTGASSDVPVAPGADVVPVAPEQPAPAPGDTTQ